MDAPTPTLTARLFFFLGRAALTEAPPKDIPAPAGANELVAGVEAAGEKALEMLLGVVPVFMELMVVGSGLLGVSAAEGGAGAEARNEKPLAGAGASAAFSSGAGGAGAGVLNPAMKLKADPPVSAAGAGASAAGFSSVGGAAGVSAAAVMKEKPLAAGAGAGVSDAGSEAAGAAALRKENPELAAAGAGAAAAGAGAAFKKENPLDAGAGAGAGAGVSFLASLPLISSPPNMMALELVGCGLSVCLTLVSLEVRSLQSNLVYLGTATTPVVLSLSI